MEFEKKGVWNGENPVIEGLFADPDLCMVNGTYYIYPTTDGYAGWSGHEFYVFTSRDGKHFQKGPGILDVASEQVPWATGCAWAPCMTEKNGKYYFYFCAKDAAGVSCIGAASADSPEGPFTAGAEPVITPDRMREYGIAMGQTIDPSVYREGEDAWLVFGNGAAAVVKLSEDMLHIETDTLKNIEGLKDFCESLIVFKRGDRYHFSWSCNDTRSEDYHVNYGVSDSLYGPVTFIRTILEKDREKEILGTGHHSILKVPGEDRYLTAYHRFARPLADYPEGSARGWHRETCMAELAFDEEGYLLPVTMR